MSVIDIRTSYKPFRLSKNCEYCSGILLLSPITRVWPCPDAGLALTISVSDREIKAIELTIDFNVENLQNISSTDKNAYG